MKSGNHVYEEFKKYFPKLSKDVTEFWSSGPMSIYIRLKDDSVYEYDNYDNALRSINTDVHGDGFTFQLNKYIRMSGKTKQMIADELGITPTMLSRYCVGTSVPTLDKAYKLAKILGISMDEMFDDYYLRKGGL